MMLGFIYVIGFIIAAFDEWFDVRGQAFNLLVILIAGVFWEYSLFLTDEKTTHNRSAPSMPMHPAEWNIQGVCLPAPFKREQRILVAIRITS